MSSNITYLVFCPHPTELAHLARLTLAPATDVFPSETRTRSHTELTLLLPKTVQPPKHNEWILMAAIAWQ